LEGEVVTGILAAWWFRIELGDILIGGIRSGFSIMGPEPSFLLNRAIAAIELKVYR